MKLEQVVGERIALARSGHDWSQATLGAAMEPYTGHSWSRHVVWAAEQGRRDFRAAELVALATVLERPVSWFLHPRSPTPFVSVGAVKMSSEQLAAVTANRFPGTTGERRLVALEGFLRQVQEGSSDAMVCLNEVSNTVMTMDKEASRLMKSASRSKGSLR
jgi:transcriptional regulator with XRE-family HTH domain